MIDLQQEVSAWCRSILPEGCDSQEQLAELEDHLMCEIERLEETGLPRQEAFEQATRRMGKASMIMNEYSKNQSFVARLCALDRKLSGAERLTDPKLRKTARRLLVGNSLLWAAAMIATALLSSEADDAGRLVPLVFVPLWFASFALINSTMSALARSAQA